MAVITRLTDLILLDCSMEPALPRKRGRPRKRPLPEVENDVGEKSAPDSKRQTRSSMKPIALVGRYVLKEFSGNGTFLGKIVCYDTGLYRVDYEDGDCEDLESRELRNIIIDESDFTDELNRKRKRLDKRVSSKRAKTVDVPEKNEVDKAGSSSGTEVCSAPIVEDNGDVADSDVDADSSSESFECEQDGVSGSEAEPIPVPPAPLLPKSSESIGVLQEYVPHLLSVYGFLRSFSVTLFLYPFGLDDLVGAVNCNVPNTLLDAIHASLMLVLKRHLENLSSEGSEPASKCLRCVDWSLLDTLTWPVYVFHYLTLMGYVKGLEWRWFFDGVLEKDYYSLPAWRKLLILQILCDEVLESAELRAEIDIREESEVGIDPDGVASNPADNRPRRVHPRYSKTSACYNREVMEVISDSHDMKSRPNSNSKASTFDVTEMVAAEGNVDEDSNGDECRLCGMDGTLLCCDGCPSAYHSRCIGVAKMYIPEGPCLKTSFSEKSYCRYYNQKDIVKVLQALNSSMQLAVLYLDICKAIVKHWDIPDSVFSLSKIMEACMNQGNHREAKHGSAQPLSSSGKESQKVVDAVEVQSVSNVTGNSTDAVPLSSGMNLSNGSQRTHIDAHDPQIAGDLLKECSLVSLGLRDQVRGGTDSCSGSINQQAEPSNVTCQSVCDRSSTANHVINMHSNGMPHNKSSSSTVHQPTGMAVGDRKFAGDCLFFGFLFKPQAYINHYMQAYFAASAAANLATLSAEEGQVLEGHAARNPKKVVSVISQQMKAFSRSASRFFWPSSEKKLWEVPRERCGWCYSCKSGPASRRGCMLNSAATIVSKSTLKVLSGLHPIKSGEGCLPSMATYILLIEESFHGLIGGPFLNENFRREWRKMVVEASSCVILKALLLKLEEHIRPVALSGDWFKLVDDWSAECSVTQGTTCTTGIIQKRGPGGRPNKKQSTLSEDTEDDCLEKSFSWWRGGKLSKILLNKAVLACSMIKRAAHQAGLRKIAGVHYADGFEVPKRSRQSVWRAAVEMSKNASQLALQVRYLDLFLRWNDLIRPELNLPDGKGPEIEVSAFRNASVCDKKISKNKIVYGVDFGMQKHLPSRVMKTIIEVEPIQGGNEKYWSYETHIPLYLIKEYEERSKMLSPSEVPSNVLVKLRRMRFKAARMDIFSYLEYRRDNVEKFSCSSCQLHVSIRDVVKCSVCQGYCHDGCIIFSKSSQNGQIQSSMTCKRCHHAKAFIKKESTESPTSPLLLQVRDYPKTKTVHEVPKIKISIPPSLSVKSKEKDAKNGTSATKARNTTWGIIWNKRNIDDTGSDFRKENILLIGNADRNRPQPVCKLCQKPYHPDLIYIRCPSCSNWYHADALEVKASRVPEVLGFKCCKCRRIKSPECPYDDKVKNRVKQQQPSNLKQDTTILLDSDSGDMSESKGWEPSTPMISSEELSTHEVDPLLQSASRVEHLKDENLESGFDWATASGPQKLPVRRHLKRDSTASFSLAGNDFSHLDPSTSLPTDIPLSMDNGQTPTTAWKSMHENEQVSELGGFSYEDMEFEPQTYFTYTELLGPDGIGQLGAEDAPGEWDNLDAAISQDGGFAFNDELEHAISLDTSVDVQCQVCLGSEPLPNLSCEVCGLCIHNQCSPWDESEIELGGWRCGNCREWR
ncbi:hypothetical protein CRG98_000843 [Punica granatum]|uniref:DDT domain-containing protein n=1 Tax=Punica granatum TaxID=22663 RepID=A0A2I0LEY3_PUNGR|nr:hypothetical protein CRG98_000843 [Punica granatum]